MKNSSFPFKRLLLVLLIVLAAGAAFIAPWVSAVLLVPALIIVSWPNQAAQAPLLELDRLLDQVGRGSLVERLPHELSAPTLEAIRVNLNSVLDQTETAFREILGAMSASSETGTGAACKRPACTAPSRMCLTRCRPCSIKLPRRRNRSPGKRYCRKYSCAPNVGCLWRLTMSGRRFARSATIRPVPKYWPLNSPAQPAAWPRPPIACRAPLVVRR